MTRELVYGRRPVRELYRGPREVLETWVTERASAQIPWLEAGPKPHIKPERALSDAAGTRECVELLRSQLLPRVNQFCYGQVRSLYGSGRFAHDLEEYLGGEETLVISEIADRDDIYDAIKDFLGKGK